jgi:hypothetical protein
MLLLITMVIVLIVYLTGTSTVDTNCCHCNVTDSSAVDVNCYDKVHTLSIFC